jgi:hypothetical protein
MKIGFRSGLTLRNEDLQDRRERSSCEEEVDTFEFPHHLSGRSWIRRRVHLVHGGDLGPSKVLGDDEDEELVDVVIVTTKALASARLFHVRLMAWGCGSDDLVGPWRASSWSR